MADNLDIRARLLGAARTKRDLKEINAELGATTREQKRAADASKAGFLGKLTTGASVLAGLGIAEVMKESVKGALNLNQAMTNVNNQLANVGIRSKDVTEQIKAQAEAASTRGGGTTEQELAGLAQYIQQTHSLATAQRAQAAANVMARSTGLDYSQTQQMIASAEAGRTRGLARYIGVIKPVKTASDALTNSYRTQLYAAQQQAAQLKHGGSAWLRAWEQAHKLTPEMREQAAQQDKLATGQMMVTAVLNRYRNAQESTRQKLEDARHAFQNLAANLGTLLLPAINKIIHVAADLAQWLTRHRAVAIALGATIATLATVILVGKFVGALRRASRELGIAGLKAKLFGASATTAGEEAAAAGTASELAGTEAAAGATAATTGWRIFAASTLIGLVLVAITMVITHWKQVKKMAVDAAHAMASAFKTAAHAVMSAIEWIGHKFMWLMNNTPFGTFMQLAKGGAGAVGNLLHGNFGGAAKSLMHGAGGALHAATFGLLRAGGTVYKAAGGPSGTDTVPAMLTPGEVVLSRAQAQAIGIGNLQQGLSGLAFGREPLQLELRVEGGEIKLTDAAGRVLGQTVLKYALNRAARGTGSNVGGALATQGGYAG